jgi:2-methylcitrate dehydratase PrpD
MTRPAIGAQGPGRSLAEYAATSRFSDLPAEVADRAKMVVFDELGCEFIGRSLPAGQLISAHVQRQGGAADARIVGTDTLVPAPLAALANGTAGHADEFDSPHATADFRGTGHPACVIVPAAIAVGESTSAGGRDLINAVSVGYDVGARVISTTGGLGPLRDRHGLYAGALHSFGAAAASCRLLGLDAERHLYAAALASGQSISLSAFFSERHHMSKALVAGQSAHAGVSAALLASIGFKATANIYETRFGVLETWAVPGREAELDKDLGADHAIMGVNFKFYSAGYPIHAPVEAALALQARYGISAEDVLRVVVQMPSFAASVVDNRDMPSICLQDMLAVAMVAGRLGVHEAHSAELLDRPVVRRLRQVVEVVGDAEFDRRQPHGRGARVSLFTADAVVDMTVEHPRGHRFRTPHTTWQDLVDKWLPELVPELGQERFERFLGACQELETVESISEVTQLLAVGKDRPPAPSATTPTTEFVSPTG